MPADSIHVDIGVPAGPPADLSEATDVQLLAGCRAGDAASWDALVHRYERLVYSVALRCGLRPADAADVAQTTFIALLNAGDRLRNEERLAAWLVTVTRRHSWRVLSRAGQETLLAELPDGAAEPPEWEEVAALHGALVQLGQPCRDLLIALYFDPDEPSYAEIAARFGRAVGGIGPLRGRCLAHLRALLAQEDR